MGGEVYGNGAAVKGGGFEGHAWEVIHSAAVLLKGGGEARYRWGIVVWFVDCLNRALWVKFVVGSNQADSGISLGCYLNYETAIPKAEYAVMAFFLAI